MDKNALRIIRLSVLLIVLNIADLLLTRFLVPAGLAIEINPFADLLLYRGTDTFTLVKLCGVSIACTYAIVRARQAARVKWYFPAVFLVLAGIYSIAIIFQLIALLIYLHSATLGA